MFTNVLMMDVEHVHVRCFTIGESSVEHAVMYRKGSKI
jgi:hypothetical protein